MGKKLVLLSLLFFLLFYGSQSVYAVDQPLFTIYAEKNTVEYNDEVEVSIKANKNDLNEIIAGFRINLYYDSDILTFKKVVTSSQIKKNDFRYYKSENTIAGVYVCDGVTKNELIGDCLTFVFTVNKEFDCNKTEIKTLIDQIVDWQANMIDTEIKQELSFEILPPPTDEAELLNLKPSFGSLDPKFTSDHFEYEVSVPNTISQIEFEATPSDRASVKINRKRLNKAGTPTTITITVTSPSKKSKVLYTIIVNREEQEEELIVANTSHSSKKRHNQTKNSTTENQMNSKVLSQKSSSSNGMDPHKENDAKEGIQPKYYGDRNLYIMGNQMPAYMVGMLIACMCMLTGALLLPFLTKSKKK